MRFISLFAIIILLFSCSRKDNPDPQIWFHQYTERLDRDITWKRSVHSYGGANPDTTIILSDTSFPIIVLNDTTLIFLQDTLNYTSRYYPSQGVNWLVDTTQILHFVDLALIYPHNKSILDYYYQMDSVEVSYTSGGNGGGRTLYYNALN